MQSLNSNLESCRDLISLERNDAFKSNKILLHNLRDSGQASTNLVFFEQTTRRINYGPIHDQLLKVETPPSQTVTVSTRNLDKDYKNRLANEEMCTSQSSNSSAALKYLSSTITNNDLLNNSTNKTVERTNKSIVRRKKVGDILSTSRSGHLIEKKDEFCCSTLKKAGLNSAEGCDSNDNIINEKVLNCEMFDINDNPSDKINIQREEETSLSDNAQSGKSDCQPPCGISLLERLIRSHSVWFLPGIQRAGAVHLLQGKEEGNFIVRQSSQADTMAVSVRLPVGKGPYIEHYLIQSVDGQLSLESSENMFESIPSLIAHYCQCCDELPVRLTLPGTIREAKNRQQLSSLALLGQEFWRYPMANPRPPESQHCSPNNNKSFDSSDEKKIFKANEEIVLDLVPLNSESQQQPSLLSTFKSSPVDGISFSVVDENKPKRPQTLNLNTNLEKTALPNGNKTPPQPPPRWTKTSQRVFTKQSFLNATTEITTITSQTIYDENGCVKLSPRDFSPSVPDYEINISSPQSDQTNLKSFGFKRDQNSLNRFNENKLHLISPSSDNTNFISKSFEKAQKIHQSNSGRSGKLERAFGRSQKEGKIKESAHYQESDILESPTLYYCKSNVADKQSDYEDIWAADSFTTFKPPNPAERGHDPDQPKADGKSDLKKPPDLLEKLDDSFRRSFKEEDGGEEKNSPGGDLPSECLGFDGRNMDQYDVKQSSPFYAEPADALVVRRKARSSFASKSRHSDPFSFNNWSIHMNPYFSGGNILGKVDSQSEAATDESNPKAKSSLSFDNIINLKKKETEAKSRAANPRGKNIIKGKPVRPPKIYNFPLEKVQQNWAVDSSWEFIGNEEVAPEKEGEGRFPSIEQQMDSEEASYKDTVQEMISKRYPQFKISRAVWNKCSASRMNSFSGQQMQKLENGKSCSRISAYDNLSCDRFNVFATGNDSEKNGEASCCEGSQADGENPTPFDSLRQKRRLDCGSATIEDDEDAQTIFSEPWDSSRWEKLLPPNLDSSEEPCLSGIPETESEIAENPFKTPRNSSKSIKKKFFYDERLDLPFSFQRTGSKIKELSATGASIRSYALHLASDKSTTFAQNIDNFIECTLESKEASPQVVMRNMRQFMSGMKNYLVKHGEREFEKQVEKERSKLKSTEFLNLDAILEGVMHKLVVRPLREHLYKLFVDEYVKNGAIQLLYENLNYARTKSLRDLGLKTKITPPSHEALKMICHFVSKLQEVDSPLEKLDNLLATVSTIIYSLTQSNQGRPGIALGADDILPLFVWVLIQSGFIAAEIEAEYMWGLLHPALLSGEGCYYLTTLSSAVHVLKNLKSCDLDRQRNRSASTEGVQCRDLKSVLKIIVPDELQGSILTKTLPVKPNMTTKDVCKIIAHKIRITNPQDYGLFRLVDGEETLLNDSDCPQDVKCRFVESGRHCTLAYKRIDAKIGWPRTT